VRRSAWCHRKCDSVPLSMFMKSMFMKRATAYKRGDRILLHASSKTIDGVWVLTAPVLTEDRNNSVRLGKAVLDALDGSKEGIDHPTSWTGVFDPVLRLAGVKSWNAFTRSAKCVEIEFGTNQVTFVPTKNLGPKDGFEPLSTEVRTSPPECNAVGMALLSAFAAAV
jgi:hypothetical protein